MQLSDSTTEYELGWMCYDKANGRELVAFIYDAYALSLNMLHVAHWEFVDAQNVRGPR